MSRSSIASRRWLLALIARATDTKTARPSSVVPYHLGNRLTSSPVVLQRTASLIWDGLDDPAGGRLTLLRPVFPCSFPSAQECPFRMYACRISYCEATYGQGGSFTLNGALGTFTAVVTSGYAYENLNNGSFETYVTFTGRWSNGQQMHGTADERYEDSLQIPDTDLQMSPGP